MPQTVAQRADFESCLTRILPRLQLLRAAFVPLANGLADDRVAESKDHIIDAAADTLDDVLAEIEAEFHKQPRD